MSRILRLALAGVALLGGLFVATSPQPATAQTASQDTAAALPPDFRGRVAYHGSFIGRRTISRRPLRRLDLESLIRTATSGGTESYSGDYWGELQFNGSAVAGRLNGTGLESGNVSGSRSGTHCRLLVDGIGASIEGECTATRFTGRVTSPPGEPRPYRIDFDAQATRLVDAVEEERRTVRLAAEAAQRQAAERREYSAASVPDQRQTPSSGEAGQESGQHNRSSEIQAEALMTGGRVRIGGPLARQIDQIIHFDSQSWLFLGYQLGSVTAVQTRRLGSHGDFYVRANFRYRGGSAGWAGLLVEQGNFICVEYPDTYGDCRRIGGGFRARVAEAFTPRQQSLLEMLQEDSARCSRARAEGRLVAC